MHCTLYIGLARLAAANHGECALSDVHRGLPSLLPSQTLQRVPRLRPCGARACRHQVVELDKEAFASGRTDGRPIQLQRPRCAPNAAASFSRSQGRKRGRSDGGGAVNDHYPRTMSTLTLRRGRRSSLVVRLSLNRRRHKDDGRQRPRRRLCSWLGARVRPRESIRNLECGKQNGFPACTPTSRVRGRGSAVGRWGEERDGLNLLPAKGDDALNPAYRERERERERSEMFPICRTGYFIIIRP